MRETGMSERYIPLSEGRTGLAEEHGLHEVRGMVYRDKGDGWVTNEWMNHHLVGNILIYRRPHKKGGKHYYEFLPIENALLQTELVGKSIDAEADRLAGYRQENGEYMAGEIDHVGETRTKLSNWLTLTDQEKTDIFSRFSELAKPRTRAVNSLNIAVGARAARALELQNNPRAVMAMTHPMERDLEDRFMEVIKGNLHVNNVRTERIKRWVFQENRMLAAADSRLEKIITDQRDDDFYALQYNSRQLRFRLQPFNMIGHAIRQTRYKLEDVTVAEQAREGLRFHRLSNYLLTPFRKMTALSLTELEDSFTQQADKRLPDISERMAVLEETGITKGPYYRLIGRLLVSANEVQDAFHSSDARTAKQSAEKFKWLVQYLCEPKDDPEAEIWYRYKLY